MSRTYRHVPHWVKRLDETSSRTDTPMWVRHKRGMARGDDGSIIYGKASAAYVDNMGGFKINHWCDCLKSKHQKNYPNIISKARRAAGKKLIAIGLEDYEEILDDLWLANQGYLDDDWYESQERRIYEEWLDDLEEEERQADYDDWYDDEPTYDPYDD